tara:strand:- start:1369 stop:2511 length:1143 start_codon:yes stop_codon:yes gene_type:complete
MNKRNIIQNTLPCFPKAAVPEALNDIKDILENNAFILGKKTEEFEKRFAEYIGTDYAVSVNSATSALQICFSYFGAKGNEVILPTNTFLASPNAVIYAQGRPVLADIDRETLCLSVSEIKKSITTATRGVCIVHVNGIITPDILEIKKLCAEKDLFFIEDCAHAHGSQLQKIKAGNFSDAGCFSFYPTKAMTTGTGGMITTNNKDLVNFARSVRHHGQGKSLNDIQNLGNDWVMTEISAALGIHHLSYLDDQIERRSQIADRYTDLLSSTPYLRIVKPTAGQKCCHYKYQAILDKSIDKEGFKQSLFENYGVKLGSVYWPTCHLQPVYKKEFGYKLGDFPIAEEALSSAITLPLHLDLKDEDVDFIAECVSSEILKHGAT